MSAASGSLQKQGLVVRIIYHQQPVPSAVVAQGRLDEGFDVSIVIFDDFDLGFSTDLAVSGLKGGVINGCQSEHGAVLVLVAETEGGFKGNLGLAHATKTFQDYSLAVILVRTRRDLEEFRMGWLLTKSSYRLRGTTTN